ncbi:hypothetical protein HDU93_002222 [Gonapodya sp. JEL0774]|nr:hypothetical protein HDU93_002222 [Gonapodya sp. JEL0774]
MRCHRDKKKCDGQRPCLHCRRHSRKCDYTRTPAVKSRAAYRASLEQRLSQLEKMLAASGVDPQQFAAMAGSLGAAGGFNLSHLAGQLGGLANFAGLASLTGALAALPGNGPDSADGPSGSNTSMPHSTAMAMMSANGLLLQGMLDAEAAAAAGEDDGMGEDDDEFFEGGGMGGTPISGGSLAGFEERGEEGDSGVAAGMVGTAGGTRGRPARLVDIVAAAAAAAGGRSGVGTLELDSDDSADASYGTGSVTGKKRKRGGATDVSGSGGRRSGTFGATMAASGKKRGRGAAVGGGRGKSKIKGGSVSSLTSAGGSSPVQSSGSRRSSARKAAAAIAKQGRDEDEDDEERVGVEVEKDVQRAGAKVHANWPDRKERSRRNEQSASGDEAGVGEEGMDTAVDESTYPHINAPYFMDSSTQDRGEDSTQNAASSSFVREREYGESDKENESDLEDVDSASEHSVGSRVSEISLGFAERCEREREKAERRLNSVAGGSNYTPLTPPPMRSHPDDESAGLEFAGVVRGFSGFFPDDRPHAASPNEDLIMGDKENISMSPVQRLEISAMPSSGAESPAPSHVRAIAHPHGHHFDDLSSAASVLTTLRRHPSPYPTEPVPPRPRAGTAGSNLRELASPSGATGGDMSISPYSGSHDVVTSRAASKSPVSVASPRLACAPARVGTPATGGGTAPADGYAHLSRVMGQSGLFGEAPVSSTTSSTHGRRESPVVSVLEELAVKVEEEGVWAKKRKVRESSACGVDGGGKDQRSLALVTELAGMAIDPNLARAKVHEFRQLVETWERDLGGDGSGDYVTYRADSGLASISTADSGMGMVGSFA